MQYLFDEEEIKTLNSRSPEGLSEYLEGKDERFIFSALYGGIENGIIASFAAKHFARHSCKHNAVLRLALSENDSLRFRAMQNPVLTAQDLQFLMNNNPEDIWTVIGGIRNPNCRDSLIVPFLNSNVLRIRNEATLKMLASSQG